MQRLLSQAARRSLVVGFSRRVPLTPTAALQAQSLRWVTTQSAKPSANGAAADNAPGAAAGPPPVAPAPEAEAATSPIITRLNIAGVSPEDQERITRALQNPTTEPHSRLGGPGIGPAKGTMVAAFTCGRCDYRMVKRFNKDAYTKGIVIIECPSCSVRHLLADNLGWFSDEARNIEDILREKGEAFTRIGGGDFEVQPSSHDEAK